MLQQMKYADNITEIMPIRIEILLKQLQKRWRKANPDKIREYNARYWNRRAQEVKEGETSGKNNSRST